MQSSAFRMLAFIPTSGCTPFTNTLRSHSVGQAAVRRLSSMPGTRRRLRWMLDTERRGVLHARLEGAVGVEEEVDPGELAGTSLRILRYPHPLLRAANEDVPEGEFDDALRKLAREMLLVMYASNGVGLAAPQVGVNKRLLVFNPEGKSNAFVHEVVLVNPSIVATSKKTLIEEEGCLSFPGMSGNVQRNEWVKVEALRLNGKKFNVKFEGWKARIFQHEYDHLQGVLYVDHLQEEDRKNVAQRLGEFVDEYKENPYEGMGAAL